MFLSSPFPLEKINSIHKKDNKTLAKKANTPKKIAAIP